MVTNRPDDRKAGDPGRPPENDSSSGRPESERRPDPATRRHGEHPERTRAKPGQEPPRVAPDAV
jgi:hypothetical protein